MRFWLTTPKALWDLGISWTLKKSWKEGAWDLGMYVSISEVRYHNSQISAAWVTWKHIPKTSKKEFWDVGIYLVNTRNVETFLILNWDLTSPISHTTLDHPPTLSATATALWAAPTSPHIEPATHLITGYGVTPLPAIAPSNALVFKYEAAWQVESRTRQKRQFQFVITCYRVVLSRLFVSVTNV